MKKQAAGYTLVEMTIVFVLISLMSSVLIIGIKKMDDLALQTKAKEIASEIEYAKKAAALTEQQYNIFFCTDRVLVRKEMQKPIYKVYLAPNQKFVMDLNKVQALYFNGNFITGDACTVILVNEKIRKQAIITVGVATSKVNIYYRKI